MSTLALGRKEEEVGGWEQSEWSCVHRFRAASEVSGPQLDRGTGDVLSGYPEGTRAVQQSARVVSRQLPVCVA